MTATFSTTSAYKEGMQLLLLDVLTRDDFTILSNTTSRIDYGIDPMQDAYVQFFGYGMDGSGSGWVTDIDVYWPNVDSVGVIIEGLPDLPMADFFAVAEADDPQHALNLLLARSDWTGTGTGSLLGETFWGFYSAETINAGGGYDLYVASMGIGQARDIVDIFDGSAGKDDITLRELSTGARVDLEAGLITFSEEVSGVSYDRTIKFVGVEEVTGSPFNDIMAGSSRYDTLNGGAGADVIRGARGDDQFHGDLGDDRLYGGWGQDWLHGDGGDDRLEGGGSNDILEGGSGVDLLLGGLGNDKLYGEVGNDVLRGEDGDDLLSGGAGLDRLVGGLGDDTLTGGVRRDVFVFFTGGDWQGEDRITDFELNFDRLALRGTDTSATVSHEGADTVIEYDGGVIRLLDVLWPEEGVLTL